MKKLMISLCLFLTLGVSQSNAGLLVEPYVGYEMYDLEGPIPSSNLEFDFEKSGVSFGGRLGFQTFGLMFGGVYEMNPSYTFKTNNSEFEKCSSSKMGVFVGYDFPLFVRAWATYFLDISEEQEDGTELELNKSATSIGVGLTFLPLVSLNVEYRIYTPEDIVVGQSTSEADANEIYLSLSLPLNL